MSLATITDEKLDEYLAIWHNLIEQGHKSLLDITLTADFHPLPRYALASGYYTLAFGEEKRELTFEQAIKVGEWFEQERGEHEQP